MSREGGLPHDFWYARDSSPLYTSSSSDGSEVTDSPKEAQEIRLRVIVDQHKARKENTRSNRYPNSAAVKAALKEACDRIESLEITLGRLVNLVGECMVLINNQMTSAFDMRQYVASELTRVSSAVNMQSSTIETNRSHLNLLNQAIRAIPDRLDESETAWQELSKRTSTVESRIDQIEKGSSKPL